MEQYSKVLPCLTNLECFIGLSLHVFHTQTHSCVSWVVSDSYTPSSRCVCAGLIRSRLFMSSWEINTHTHYITFTPDQSQTELMMKSLTIINGDASSSSHTHKLLLRHTTHTHCASVLGSNSDHWLTSLYSVLWLVIFNPDPVCCLLYSVGQWLVTVITLLFASSVNTL